MTPEKRAALRALADRATPGPWRLEEGTTLVWGHCAPDDHSSYGMGFPVAEARLRLPQWESKRFRLDDDIAEANAAFIAEAREAVPALLAALSAAEQENVEEVALRCGAIERMKAAETERDAARTNAAQLLVVAKMAAAQFDFYAAQHEAKGTQESALKALVNRNKAAECREAIERAEPKEAEA